jgi:copper chaperone CopZ
MATTDIRPNRQPYPRPRLKALDPDKPDGSHTAILAITRMYCRACVTRVREGLLSWAGVLRAEVDLARATARVDYQSRIAFSIRDMLEAVEAAGGDTPHGIAAVFVA